MYNNRMYVDVRAKKMAKKLLSDIKQWQVEVETNSTQWYYNADKPKMQPVMYITITWDFTPIG